MEQKTKRDYHLDDETVNIREELEKYFIYWRWFVLSAIIALVGAFLYLRYSTPLYKAEATILIKDNQKSGISQELSAIADLGIVGNASINNTDNEIYILKSRKIIGDVVDSLDLTTTIYTQGRIKETEAYKKRPIALAFLVKDSLFFKTKDTAFVVKILNERNFQLLDVNENVVNESSFNTLLQTDLGAFKIQKTANFDIENLGTLKIVITPRFKVIDRYRNAIQVDAVDKNSSVLTLSLSDVDKTKAEDILDVLVNQYNKDALNDKNEVSRKTKTFIEDRLTKVGIDLANIQDSVKNFKTKTGFTGLSTQGEIILQSVQQNNQKLFESQTQLSISKWVYERLVNDEDDFELLPSNLGFRDEGISKAVDSYNDLILERNVLKIDAGVKNPLLLQVESQLNNLKRTLLQSLQNYKMSIELQIKELKDQERKINSKVASIPITERGFIDIARQQEIISELFSYLLKKKEETSISLAVAVANAKIIDKAYSSNLPVSPKRKIIYLAALLIGLLVPFVLIYIRNLLDTKIHNKKDIEDNLSIPFLGDIPTSEVKEKIVIGKDFRSSTSEAFRLIRTNLDFILSSNSNKSTSSKTIFVTSTTSGEGKSFISINIASVLAMSGKKVLLIGMDLRAPKVTEYLGLPDRKGVTNYITDENLELNSLKFQIPEVKKLDIISSGVIPPNPAELLMSKRIENMFTIIKEEYDFIIVDTAPVNLVTDTLLIAKQADMFMYVVRANYLDKRLLVVPQNLYDEKRLPNMAIVLNDTDPKRSYGYGYGGYGYGYLVEQQKPWYQKIFKR